MPSTPQITVVYQYVCLCECRYVGCTTERLHDRITQQIPKSTERILPSRKYITKILTLHNYDSAIDIYLQQNHECFKFYNDQQFSILAIAKTSFHLPASEATHTKIHRPVLSRQKEFVYAFQISYESDNCFGRPHK